MACARSSAVMRSGGAVAVIDLQNLVVEETISPGMAVGKAVITPDSTTALFIAQSGVNDVLFVNLNTKIQSTMGGDLAGYTTTAIDIEEGGQYAWVHDPVNEVLIIIDIAAHSTVSGGGMGAPGSSPHGRFLGRLIFTDTGGPNTISTDADLTSSLFGQEVLVGGTVNINDGFSSARTFRFVGAAPRLELGSGTITFDGPLTGAGFEVATASSATLRMTGTASLSGAIDVTAGVTLQADGTHSGPITLQSTAILSGTGTAGDVTAKSGSSVRPGGANPGILTVGDITFETGSSLSLEINGATAGTGYDRLVTTSATLQSGVTLQTSRGYAPAPGDTFTILTNLSGRRPIRSTAPPAAALTTSARYNTIVRYDGGTGNDMTLTVDAVPTASAIANDTIDEDGVYNGTVTVGDDLTPVNSLTVTATSNAQWLVPNANITIGTTGSVRAHPDHAGRGHVRRRDHHRARRRRELLCRSARSC